MNACTRSPSRVSTRRFVNFIDSAGRQQAGSYRSWCLRSAEFFEVCEHLRRMFGRLHFLVVLRDQAIRANDKCLPLGDGHAEHSCLDAVSGRGIAINIGEQWEGKTVIL